MIISVAVNAVKEKREDLRDRTRHEATTVATVMNETDGDRRRSGAKRRQEHFAAQLIITKCVTNKANILCGSCFRLHLQMC